MESVLTEIKNLFAINRTYILLQLRQLWQLFTDLFTFPSHDLPSCHLLMQINMDIYLQNVKMVENPVDICEISPLEDLILHDLEISIEEQLVLPISGIPKPLVNLQKVVF